MQGRFTHLKLGNWRNFRRVDVALEPRVFVVGPNASGKSNLLDVFRFLQELAVDGGGLTNALEGSNRGGIRAVRSLHAGGNPHVEIDVHVEVDERAWRYRLVLEAMGTPQKPGPARVVEELVECDGERVLKRPSAEDKEDPELLLATALEQRTANAKFRALRDFLRSVEYIHVVPQLVRAPVQGDLRRFGKGLGTGLIAAMSDVPERARRARLKRIERALKGVLPQFEKLEWLRDSRGVPHLRAKYRHWRPQGGWQQESSFSDGTLRLIGLLWFLSTGGGPLLLEEPELSLHTDAVRRIPRIIANVGARTGRQVIMTTHSWALVSDRGIEPTEVLVLTADGDATTVESGGTFDAIVSAARADLPLGPTLEAVTRPRGVDQLDLFGGES